MDNKKFMMKMKLEWILKDILKINVQNYFLQITNYLNNNKKLSHYVKKIF